MPDAHLARARENALGAQRHRRAKPLFENLLHAAREAQDDHRRRVRAGVARRFEDVADVFVVRARE